MATAREESTREGSARLGPVKEGPPEKGPAEKGTAGKGTAGKAGRGGARGRSSRAAGEAPGAQSKSEFAYEAIRRRIADGTFGSGYRLVLDQLAQELSVSPVPVREAIRRLEAEGYVVFRRNVGAQVASIDVTEYAQVMEVLAVLEAAATSLAAPLVTDADLERAAEVNEAMRASLAGFDPVEFTRLNRELHGILYARCPNEHLKEFIAREWTRLDAIRRSTFSFVPERAQAAVKEHDQLLELLASRAEPAEIEVLCRGHRMATATAFQAWHAARNPSG